MENRHACPYENCNSTFNRPYRLAQHLLVHEDKKVFKCLEENCDKAYTNNSHLLRHINSVHRKKSDEYLYSCPQCLKRYANRQNLKRHIKLYHELSVPFSCDMCKLDFKKKNQLTVHMYCHTGVKEFSCDICSEDFVTPFEKKKHMRYHKTYSCTDCSMVFNHWSKYQKHRKSQHVQKEFICDQCQRSFKERTHIVRHIKTHEASLSKVYQCLYENCTRTYCNRSNLKHHIKSKHEHKSFDCSTCNAKLSTKAKLTLHNIKMHTKCPETKCQPKNPVKRKERSDKGSFKLSIIHKLAGIKHSLF